MGGVLGVGVVYREEVMFHFVEFLHLNCIVSKISRSILDLGFHIETVLHQVTVILLQLLQHIIIMQTLILLPLLMPSPIVFVNDPHVFLIQLYITPQIPSNSILFFQIDQMCPDILTIFYCSWAFFCLRNSISQFSDCSSCLASLG